MFNLETPFEKKKLKTLDGWQVFLFFKKNKWITKGNNRNDFTNVFWLPLKKTIEWCFPLKTLMGFSNENGHHLFGSKVDYHPAEVIDLMVVAFGLACKHSDRYPPPLGIGENGGELSHEKKRSLDCLRYRFGMNNYPIIQFCGDSFMFNKTMK